MSSVHRQTGLAALDKRTTVPKLHAQSNHVRRWFDRQQTPVNRRITAGNFRLHSKPCRPGNLRLPEAVAG